MPPVRPADLTVVAFAAIAGILLAAAGAVGTAGMVGTGSASSFNSGPDGGRAAFLVLEQLGYRVERSYEPVTAIRADPATSTLILAQPVVPLSDLDRHALQQFISAGGIVLATGGGGADALGGAGVDSGSGEMAAGPRPYHAIEPGVLSAGAPTITMAAELTRPEFQATFNPVYGIETDAVVQTAVIGDGRAIWWAGPTPLTNRGIADESNLALVLNAIGGRGRTAIWDEHYHGHTRSLWSYAASTPLPWAGVQIGLILVAAGLTLTRRVGPARPRAVEPRTSPMELVETMGGLYRRAGAAQAAVASARQRLRRSLGSACGLASDCTDHQLAQAAAARLGTGDTTRLEDLLSASESASRAHSLPATDALALVRQLQASEWKLS